MTASLKLTKGELRIQRQKLAEFRAYLPILSLKKSLLQSKVLTARSACSHLNEELERAFQFVSEQKVSFSLNPHVASLLVVDSIERALENVAGVQLPYISSISWKEVSYSFAGTPAGTEQFVCLLKSCAETKIRFHYAQERLKLLEEEFKRISVRTNLIEKVLIPKLQGNIKKILVFLGDVELAAIGRSKISKKRKMQVDDGLFSSV
ncbi:V-type ATP synthase subunit D [Candidatus Similichlamydia laticola]|uniref:V-type ATP synthase subunit D n=1 Tax=Candidatus Similichlamydia laticola TaxID=2170265 RepID=A0A369KKT2_9BACT|nr:V-type ATP synthase subunit D [Candidatus Similichlamydia laticola]RDB31616.1 V-type ATP synthase subunit D [Candidatus Similichlamydia laticola]